MYKFLIFFCIFTNFWGVFLLHTFGIVEDPFIVKPNNYYNESILELGIVFVILLFFFLFKFNVNKEIPHIEVHIKRKKVLILMYFFFLLIAVSSINWGLDNSNRGEGQMDLENRGGWAGFVSNFFLLVIPYLIFIMLVKPFGKYNFVFVLILSSAIILSSITGGGRRMVVYVLFSIFIYFHYYSNFPLKKILIFTIPGVLMIPLAIVMRHLSDYASLGDVDFVDVLFSSILSVNSDPSFLWAVKSYISEGISLTPLTFLFHFISLLVPGFLYVILFDQLSYERSVFLFDELFNSNPDQGYDFMLLADFYWCFGRVGFILYVLLVVFCMRYFYKNLYSPKIYKIITSFMLVILICQQRNDFGAFLKPAAYSFVFAYLLNKLFVAKEFYSKNYSDANIPLK